MGIDDAAYLAQNTDIGLVSIGRASTEGEDRPDMNMKPEVVQLYIHDERSILERPYKELKGFRKVSLKPGETKTVTFTLDKRALSVYDETSKTWAAEAGIFKVLIGSSSRDIRQKSQFRAVGDDKY